MKQNPETQSLSGITERKPVHGLKTLVTKDQLSNLVAAEQRQVYDHDQKAEHLCWHKDKWIFCAYELEDSMLELQCYDRKLILVSPF